MNFSLRRFLAATRTRSQEFLRDHAALSWNLLVPVLMVAGFAAIFSGPGRPIFTVALLGEQAVESFSHPFLQTPHVRFYSEPDQALALRKVARHRVDLVLDLRGPTPRYWSNPESSKAQLAERLLLGSHDLAPQRETVSGEAVRYVDWLLPGILGMNLMFSCLWGVGFVIVRYRKSGHLKRLSATPLTALEFVSAQIVSRMAVVIIATIIMYIGCDLLIDFPMEGNYLDLMLLTVLGSLALTSMGLLIAARVSSEEVSSGLLNFLSAPMMILSGVFFSLDGSPEFVRWIADLLPLTHLLDAARQIMLDGVPLNQLGQPLLILSAQTLLFLGLGAWMFKWTRD